jgi:hypothetical protein
LSFIINIFSVSNLLISGKKLLKKLKFKKAKIKKKLNCGLSVLNVIRTLIDKQYILTKTKKSKYNKQVLHCFANFMVEKGVRICIVRDGLFF